MNAISSTSASATQVLGVDRPARHDAPELPMMLALSAGCLGARGNLDLLEVWPGRRVLVVLPEHPVEGPRLRDLEDGMAVVEFLERPSCASHLIGALARLGRSAPAVRADGILYVNRAMDVAELIEIAKSLHTRPDFVRLEQEGGETRLLLLGPGVMRHPLLPTLMKLMEEWHVADDLFCDLLRDRLLGARA